MFQKYIHVGSWDPSVTARGEILVWVPQELSENSNWQLALPPTVSVGGDLKKRKKNVFHVGPKSRTGRSDHRYKTCPNMEVTATRGPSPTENSWLDPMAWKNPRGSEAGLLDTSRNSSYVGLSLSVHVLSRNLLLLLLSVWNQTNDVVNLLFIYLIH